MRPQAWCIQAIRACPTGLIPTQKTRIRTAPGSRVGSRTETGTLVVSAAYGIFFDPYYTGQGGPLQTPNSAPPLLADAASSDFRSRASPTPSAAKSVRGSGFATPMTLLTLDPRLAVALRAGLEPERCSARSAPTGCWKSDTSAQRERSCRASSKANPAVVWRAAAAELDRGQRQPAAALFGMHAGRSDGRATSRRWARSPAIANSNYNALEVSLKKRFSHGLSFLASYTLSKTIDDVSSLNITGSASQSVAGENDLAQNPFDLAAERGRSMFDARHRFVFSYEWNLPFLQHYADAGTGACWAIGRSTASRRS